MIRTPPDRRAPLALLLAALALAAALSACGIPGDDGPRAISADQIDPDLLQGTTPTTQASSASTQSQTVFLVDGAGSSSQDDQFLRAVDIEVSTDENGEVSPQALVEALIATKPVAVAPDHPNYTNALPSALTVNSAFVDSDGYLHLDVDKETWQTLQNQNLYLAVAQIVFTTSYRNPQITGVLFSVDGATTPVPVENGTVEAGDAVTFATDFPTFTAQQSPSSSEGA